MRLLRLLILSCIFKASRHFPKVSTEPTVSTVSCYFLFWPFWPFWPFHPKRSIRSIRSCQFFCHFCHFCHVNFFLTTGIFQVRFKIGSSGRGCADVALLLGRFGYNRQILKIGNFWGTKKGDFGWSIVGYVSRTCLVSGEYACRAEQNLNNRQLRKDKGEPGFESVWEQERDP